MVSGPLIRIIAPILIPRPSPHPRMARAERGVTRCRTWRAAVVRWPVDLAAPSWLRMPQYRFLDTAALPFRSITIAADLRCHETDETKGAQWSTVAVDCDF